MKTYDYQRALDLIHYAWLRIHLIEEAETWKDICYSSEEAYDIYEDAIRYCDQTINYLEKNHEKEIY